VSLLRFARTLDDAFKGANYGSPIETPRGTRIGHRVVEWVCVIGVVAVVYAICFGGL
jgi:hypothetical protein